MLIVIVILMKREGRRRILIVVYALIKSTRVKWRQVASIHIQNYSKE
jgi:hypothetical protein